MVIEQSVLRLGSEGIDTPRLKVVVAKPAEPSTAEKIADLFGTLRSMPKQVAAKTVNPFELAFFQAEPSPDQLLDQMISQTQELEKRRAVSRKFNEDIHPSLLKISSGLDQLQTLITATPPDLDKINRSLALLQPELDKVLEFGAQSRQATDLANKNFASIYNKATAIAQNPNANGAQKDIAKEVLAKARTYYKEIYDQNDHVVHKEVTIQSIKLAVLAAKGGGTGTPDPKLGARVTKLEEDFKGFKIDLKKYADTAAREADRSKAEADRAAKLKQDIEALIKDLDLPEGEKLEQFKKNVAALLDKFKNIDELKSQIEGLLKSLEGKLPKDFDLNAFSKKITEILDKQKLIESTLSKIEERLKAMPELITNPNKYKEFIDKINTLIGKFDKAEDLAREMDKTLKEFRAYFKSPEDFEAFKGKLDEVLKEFKTAEELLARLNKAYEQLPGIFKDAKMFDSFIKDLKDAITKLKNLDDVLKKVEDFASMAEAQAKIATEAAAAAKKSAQDSGTSAKASGESAKASDASAKTSKTSADASDASAKLAAAEAKKAVEAAASVAKLVEQMTQMQKDLTALKEQSDRQAAELKTSKTELATAKSDIARLDKAVTKLTTDTQEADKKLDTAIKEIQKQLKDLKPGSGQDLRPVLRDLGIAIFTALILLQNRVSSLEKATGNNDLTALFEQTFGNYDKLVPELAKLSNLMVNSPNNTDAINNQIKSVQDWIDKAKALDLSKIKIPTPPGLSPQARALFEKIARELERYLAGQQLNVIQINTALEGLLKSMKANWEEIPRD